MRLFSLLLAALFATPCMAAATDPFVGTWIYNNDKSPKPTITYAIKDLGQDRYALTGSDGNTIEVKADGVPIVSPTGAKISFRKVNDHTWQMERTDSLTMKDQRMNRTYTVSSDDKTLQLVDVFTNATGSNEKTTTTYTRTSPGKSIYGEWKSVSMKDQVSGTPEKIFIETWEKDGLSFTETSAKSRTDMRFDGKVYFDKIPGGEKVYSQSGQRVGDHVIRTTDYENGKLNSRTEYTISNDGKTLTIVTRAAKSPAVYTSVWDRQ
jgi:hypothetical protein